jgi:hypothetical protein
LNGRRSFAASLIISLTVLIHTVSLLTVSHRSSWLARRLQMHGKPHRVAAMIGVVFGLCTTILVEIWLWAGCFYVAVATSDFTIALYLSTVTFSTVGDGDFVARAEWRLLGALEGVTGFLMIGWSTAFLVVTGTRCRSPLAADQPHREGLSQVLAKTSTARSLR